MRLKLHHKVAIGVFTTAAALDCAAGAWYAHVQHYPFTSGLCYALGVATTSGSSVPSGTSPLAHLVTALIQLTILPLFAATVTLATAAIAAMLSAFHIRLARDEIKKHVEAKLAEHAKAMKQHAEERIALHIGKAKDEIKQHIEDCMPTVPAQPGTTKSASPSPAPASSRKSRAARPAGSI